MQYLLPAKKLYKRQMHFNDAISALLFERECANEHKALWCNYNTRMDNQPGGGGEGESNIKKVGMLVENFEIDS